MYETAVALGLMAAACVAFFFFGIRFQEECRRYRPDPDDLRRPWVRNLDQSVAIILWLGFVTFPLWIGVL